ncbi:hypothetical protein BDV95DRAFT_578392 [Massariosphaeria phaeospora]|uniref:C2H2-type domain-containing protein n=1 Tax=Massariosphaeria phaeospora TaxID=100035 RepID=A0A7C8IAC1_9PLEO|nr:hypothetical protein BDV95DRAFT_578392 [Massariosphaeria phaeospora]
MPAQGKGGRTKRVYRCKYCARVFKRSEHNARHERVHTQERPFSCAFCDRTYSRKDLVKRHERTLHAAAYRAAHPDEFRRCSLQLLDNGLLSDTAEDLGSGSLSGHTASLLTPPTDSMRKEPYLQCNEFEPESPMPLNIDPELERQTHSPLGQFSPPSSVHEGFANRTMEPLMQDPIGLDYFELAMEYSPTTSRSQSLSESGSSAANTDLMVNRRPIDLDPLLFIDEEIHVEPPAPPGFPGLIDFSDIRNEPAYLEDPTVFPDDYVLSLPLHDEYSTKSLAYYGSGAFPDQCYYLQQE